ncbi:outer membrane beta-barrel family protein [Brevundimonas lutea]|uniref:outer membrane beta-barrel family protein n=1 Tax=Brevundimonas lutea TaxID=2293980 RepID=UPI001F0B87F7|nr:outer membrane beta-barrel family protein [Brevundimonas lutea]
MTPTGESHSSMSGRGVRAALLAGVGVMALASAAAAQTNAPPPAPSASSQTPAQTQAQPTAPAQADPPPSESEDDQDAADEATELEAITVTGQRDGIRTSIDSISYGLANDLQATTGSLADALRNVPSVEVDTEGNVSLRGDPGVTILIDGQPSGILSGAGRGQALLQLPADRYERVEVMTNPSAAYSPEGSGGVINLISKRNAPPSGTQTTGSLRVNVGEDGRWNGGLSGSWQKDKLTLSGDLNYRQDTTEVGFLREREVFDPATGALVGTIDSELEASNDQNGGVGRFTAEYRLTDRTQVTGEVRGVSFSGGGWNDSLFENRDGDGDLTSAFRRFGDVDFDFVNWGATGRVVHRFDDAGHEWTNELRFDQNSNESSSLVETTFLTPADPGFFEATENASDQTTLAFTSAYVRPTSDGGRIRAGYELNEQRPDQDFLLSRGPTEAALAPVAGQSNAFEARQTVHALYGTWERPFGEKFSAQAGLRLEQADIEIDDLTGGLSATQDYFRAYPTAHLQYQLTDDQTLRASYSRRIQRPQPSQLNPFVAYAGPDSLRSGNPDLEPQETDAFEVMWQKRQGQTFYQATAYLRDTDGAFTDVAIEVGDGILLTRPENLGGRRDLGVDLSANGQLHSTLRYSAGLNLFRQEIDPGNVTGGADREATIANGRVSLNWQPTDKDFVQLMGFWQGDSLLAQGEREGGGMLNFGYRRKLTDKLSLNVTGRDLLNSFNSVTTFETAQFRERSEQDIQLRAFYIGLTWTFGSAPRRQPEQFDFSTAPGG